MRRSTPTNLVNGFPPGMAREQVATRCLCGATFATPATEVVAKRRLWHTPGRCGTHEDVGTPARNTDPTVPARFPMCTIEA